MTTTRLTADVSLGIRHQTAQFKARKENLIRARPREREMSTEAALSVRFADKITDKNSRLGIRLVPSSELTEYRLTSVPIAIPEPRTFSKAPTQARTRASSARPNRSGTRPGAMKLSDREVQTLLKQVYGDRVEQAPQYQPVECIHVRAAPLVEQSPPVYVYQRANSWCPDTAAPRALEVSAIPLNPHYLHRPGVIAVKNYEKDALVRGAARPARQPRRGQPVRASTSVPRKSRMSLEMNGVKLTYDPKLTLNDRSAKMTKYSIDGRLYLIKDNRYNILDNISPTVIQHLA